MKYVIEAGVTVDLTTTNGGAGRFVLVNDWAGRSFSARLRTPGQVGSFVVLGERILTLEVAL